MIIEISTLAKPAFLRLPSGIRRAISVRAQEIAQGKTEGALDHGGGIFSFHGPGGIITYISAEIGVRVTIEHIISER